MRVQKCRYQSNTKIQCGPGSLRRSGRQAPLSPRLGGRGRSPPSSPFGRGAPTQPARSPPPIALFECARCNKRARGLLRDETHSQLPRRDTPTALPVPTGVAGKTRRLLDWPRKTDAVSSPSATPTERGGSPPSETPHADPQEDRARLHGTATDQRASEETRRWRPPTPKVPAGDHPEAAPVPTLATALLMARASATRR